MKGKRYITVLLAAAVLLGLCACGASPTEPTPTAAPATAEPTAAPTPMPAATARPTALGYAAEEVLTPAWIQELGACDIYRAIYIMTRFI